MKPATRTATIGPTYFWGLFMFAAFVLLAVFYFRFGPKPETYDQKRGKIRAEKLAALAKEDHEKLGSYKIVDPAKGVVQIPIDRAIELAIVDLAAKKPAPSAVKVEVPYPVGLGQPPANPAVPPPAGAAPAPGAPAPAVSAGAAATSPGTPPNAAAPGASGPAAGAPPPGQATPANVVPAAAPGSAPRLPTPAGSPSAEAARAVNPDATNRSSQPPRP